MNRLKAIVFILALVGLTGCEDKRVAPLQARVDQLDEAIRVLEAKPPVADWKAVALGSLCGAALATLTFAFIHTVLPKRNPPPPPRPPGGSNGSGPQPPYQPQARKHLPRLDSRFARRASNHFVTKNIVAQDWSPGEKRAVTSSVGVRR
jgi:hypothetical protein